MRKRLFVGAAALSVLGSLTISRTAFDRRAAEYHFALLVSLLGMLVLASARELILLFVAFELMSIPLYLLTGFIKRDAGGTGGGAEVLPRRHRLVGGHRLRHVVHLRRHRQHHAGDDSRRRSATATR